MKSKLFHKGIRNTDATNLKILNLDSPYPNVYEEDFCYSRNISRANGKVKQK